MRLSRLVAIALLLIAPLSAHATMIRITPASGSTEETGATARVDISFANFANDDRMTLKLDNTTPVSLGSRLTAVGVELPDYGWNVAFAPGGKGSYFNRLNTNVSVSPGWMNAPGGYDLMLTSDGKFEGGSPQGAPTAGESETIVLSLGKTGLSAAQLESTFANFYESFAGRYAIARFQAVGPGGQWSDKVGGETPEPSALALLAIGGLLVRRHR
jgi:hypothetical protein